MMTPSILKSPYPDLDALPERVENQPSHVWIEPTSRCNTKCAHCHHYYQDFGEDMPRELIDKVLSILTQETRQVDLIGYGEPFIAKDFDYLLGELLDREIEVFTITNGIALRDDERVRRLTRQNIRLTLSIDGARKETFEFVRPYIKFEKIIETLERLKRCADEAGEKKRLELRFNFVPMRQNIGDLADMTRLAARYGAPSLFLLPLGGEEKYFEKMRGQSLRDAPELVSPAFLEAFPLSVRLGVDMQIPPSFREMILNGAERGRGVGGFLKRQWRRAWLAFWYARKKKPGRVFEALLHGFGPRAKAGASYCLLPWNDAYFASDGALYPCCVLTRKMGDLRSDKWEDVWNGARYRNLRRTIHGWNPTRMCRECAYARGINGGDENQYARFFAKYARETIPLDSPRVEWGDGFYGVERSEEGAPSHIWMGARGELSVETDKKTRFLRLLIFPNSPTPEVHPGRGRVDGGAWEAFDHSCREITFPLARAGRKRVRLELEMENGVRVEGDPRELGLGICGLELLRK